MTVWVFVLALAVRLLHIWWLQDSAYFSVLMGDSRAYDEWAVRLAGGEWIGGEVFYQAPLYPYFLGAVYALFGRDLLLVRIIQAALGAVSTALVSDAAMRLFSRRAAMMAGLVMAFYPPAIFLSTLIQKSVLDVLLISAVIWFVARLAQDRASRLHWGALGVALGLFSLTRENGLLLVPVALLVARARAFAVCVGVACVLLPVAARNYAVGGGFYLTTSQFGPNLYIGNNAAADGTYQALREGRGDAAFEREDATSLAEAAVGRELSPGEVSAYWRDRAIEFATSQPVAWLRLLGRKAQLLVSATELPDTEAQEAHADESPLLRALLPIGHFGVLVPLAMLGVFATWPDRRRLVLLYALFATYALSVLIFFVFARYRYPLIPFVILFAAAGLASGAAALRQASWPRRLTLAALIALVAFIASRPVLATDVMKAITLTNVGVALQAQGRSGDAATYYERAIAVRPDWAPAHNNLGLIWRERGRLEAAIASYRNALRYHPDDAGAHANLAAALRARGQLQEAAVHLQRVVDLEPGDLARRYDLGNVLLELRDSAAAEAAFRQLIARSPDSAQAYSRLGVSLAAQGRFDEAIPAFQKAIALRPGFPEAERYLAMAREASRQ